MMARRVSASQFCFGIIFLFLSASIVLGWVLSSQLSEQVLAAIEQQTGLSLGPDRADYDWMRHQVTLNGIHGSGNGLEVTAKQLSLNLHYRRWFDPWLGRLPESISGIELFDARILADPDRVGLVSPPSFKLKGFSSVTIVEGVFKVKGRPFSQPFSLLSLNRSSDGKTLIHIERKGGLSWSFDGRISEAGSEAEKGIQGTLEVDGLPLADIVNQAPGGSPSDVQVEGELNAQLAVQWSSEAGIRLHGVIAGEKGFIKEPAVNMSWKSWQVKDFNFSASHWEGAQKEARPLVALALSGVTLELMEPDRKRVTESLVRVAGLLPVSVSGLTMDDSKLELPAKGAKWTLEGARVELEKTGDVYHYQVAGRTVNDGTVKLSGQGSSAGAESFFGDRFRIELKGVKLDQVMAGSIKPLPGFSIAGSDIDLTYSNPERLGKLTIHQWRPGRSSSPTGKGKEPLSRLEGLLTDSRGNAELSFKTVPGKGEVGAVIRKGVEKRLNAILEAPFSYLSRLTVTPLKPFLEHQPGKAELTGESLVNLGFLKNVMEQRPKLSFTLAVGVSESTDWPELSRVELERSLIELYSAIQSEGEGGDGSGQVSGKASGRSASEQVVIPKATRDQLVEQMYLATQKQKIPEVGQKTPEQRVQNAERWLLSHWPRESGQLEGLRQQREALIKRQLVEVGIDGSRVAVIAASQDHSASMDVPRSLLELR